MTRLLEQLEAATRKTIASAGPRYSPAVDPSAPNIEIAGLLDAISALVLGERVRARVREHAATLRKAAKDAEYALAHLASGVRITPAVISDELDALADLKTAVEIRASVACIRRHLRVASKCVERRQELVETQLTALRDTPEEQLDDARKREREVLQYRSRELREVSYSLREIGEWTSGTEGLLLADRQCALLIGAWGTGKTHFVCDFALAIAAEGVPALVVLANSMRDDLDPLDAVSAATGIGANGVDLATMLDREAKRVGRRALIMIDAINEADRTAWRRRLGGLIRTVAKYEHLGVMLTCRTPFNRAIVAKPAERQLVTLEHRGFDNQEFDAQQEFFAHYGLPAPHVPLITPEFSRPLFLKLLCEAVARLSLRSRHRQLNDVASGQKGMTFVLEHFAKSVGAGIERGHSLPALTCWKLMKGQLGRGHLGFAGRMAVLGRDYLWPSEAADEIVAQCGRPTPEARTIAAEMVSEGLMAEDMRYVDGSYVTVLTFPYQRFADHLIARHLLDSHLKTESEATVRRSFYANRPLGALFLVEGWSRQYAEPGLASAIMLEFPERVKRLGLSSEIVHYLPKAQRLVEPFVRTFLDGLYWRDSTAFTADTVRVIDRLLSFDIKWIADEMFETLTGLAARPAHPLNAASLWTRLSAMSMTERDLTWSESLRTADDTSNIHRLIAWAERSSRPVTTKVTALNEMRVLALALTTTDRQLRDRCTRSLVLLGESQHEALFELTIEALSFNDPYVGERLLAACYGVCMRRWAVETTRSPFACAVVQLAKQLVERLLRPAGPDFTWHTLTRGYAVGVVELAHRLRPGSPPRNFLRTVIPDPGRAPSPFRDVGQILEADTTDGDNAIHMDFGNYTMGRLVTDRQNYDMDHSEYSHVRRQIEDRIRSLGYSKELFGESDQRIGRSSWSERGGKKTDRYGKKYSWIAYFEMYGLRDAQGLLEEGWHDNDRTSDCDIDPSFPLEPPTWSAPLPEVFDNSPSGQLEWLEFGSVPDYRGMLNRSDVDGTIGDWVLLGATIRQEGSHGREVVAHVSSVMATSKNVDRLRREFAAGRSFGDQGIPGGGTDFYTYLGEVPWSCRYGSDVRTLTGAPKRMRARAFDYYAGGRWKAGIPVEAATRHWVWESYHSELNQVGGLDFPAPVLADFLDLRSAGGSADLIDKTGKVATLVRVAPGPAFGSHYLYVRRDLLNRYLLARGLQLVRAVWGERTMHYEFFKDGGISDEQRDPFVRRVNTFRFTDCGGIWQAQRIQVPD